jgi:hypothetical protein
MNKEKYGKVEPWEIDVQKVKIFLNSLSEAISLGKIFAQAEITSPLFQNG